MKVRQEVPELMEDLTAAGVRFVYFSPRNMRRSKPVAEKVGITFDWNCAISLRPLSRKMRRRIAKKKKEQEQESGDDREEEGKERDRERDMDEEEAGENEEPNASHDEEDDGEEEEEEEEEEGEGEPLRDPHRYISNYADWVVHARMPHGVPAISQHLQQVDNVPLLVNLCVSIFLYFI